MKKGTRTDVATAVEDVCSFYHLSSYLYLESWITASLLIYMSHNQELHSARSSFEQARFNLVHALFPCITVLISVVVCTVALSYLFNFQVTALSNIEAKKRFEFLEAVSGTMDAHLRYFKQVIYCHNLHFDILSNI